MREKLLKLLLAAYKEHGSYHKLAAVVGVNENTLYRLMTGSRHGTILVWERVWKWAERNNLL